MGRLGLSSRFPELLASAVWTPGPVPARAPQNPRVRGTLGHGVRINKVGGGRGTTRLTLPCAPGSGAEKKRRGAGSVGFQLRLARWLAGSAALISRPACSPSRFQSRPAPPPVPARPQPLLRSSQLLISRAQPGLRLPLDSSTSPLRLLRATGPELSAAWC